MSKNDTTSAIVDGVLKLVVTTGSLAAGVVIPNLLIALDKPLGKFWRHMDKKQKERELRRIISYMKSTRLLSENYKHGLQITDKGRKRLNQSEFDSLRVKTPRKWDGRWRLIIYDVPEEYKEARKAFAVKLNKLGFYQLQRSAWLHPFPCREAIEIISSYYQIDKYISYIETVKIDNQRLLIDKFQARYPAISFK